MTIVESLDRYLDAVQHECGEALCASMFATLWPALRRLGHEPLDEEHPRPARVSESRARADLLRLLRDQHGRVVCEAVRRVVQSHHDLWSTLP